MKVLVVGNCARIDCIVDAIKNSPHKPELYGYTNFIHASLFLKCRDVGIGDHTFTVGKESLLNYALSKKIDLAIIGSETALYNGIADELQAAGIMCFGPTKEFAQIESSKSFTRNLMKLYNIEGSIPHKYFTSMNGLPEFLEHIGDFVIKPDGLTSGKGVKVWGDDFSTIREALDYAESLFPGKILIEQKLFGQEFSLQSIVCGGVVVDTIPVQDKKRAYYGDSGPNTGGMGSYSCENHLLPFLTKEQLAQASKINRDVANALQDHISNNSCSGKMYKGVLYGGFMLTTSGKVKVIEYNCRFGDPEVMNILPIMKNDLLTIILDTVYECLDTDTILEFENKATVVKYIVPFDYPYPLRGEKEIHIDSPCAMHNLKIYWAGVEMANSRLILTGSRAIAMCGIGSTLMEADEISTWAIQKIKGDVRYRVDIIPDNTQFINGSWNWNLT